MCSTANLIRTLSCKSGEPLSEKTATGKLSKGRMVVLISSLNATVTVGGMNTGMLTVLLPNMGEDLHMSRSLLLWYIFSLFWSSIRAHFSLSQACFGLFVNLHSQMKALPCK